MSSLAARARRLAGRIPLAAPLLGSLRARRAAAALNDGERGPRALLVYQMGKVGSATVERALDRLELDRPVIHVHFLSTRHLDVVAGGRSCGFFAPPEPKLGWALRRRIHELGPRIRCDIVTLVRDPIAREVSGLFQNPERAPVDLRGDCAGWDVSRAVGHLKQRLDHDYACDYAHGWFDRELKEVFGVDVFAQPFDAQRGYQVIEGERARVLVLRLEDLDATLARGLSELLSREVTLPEASRHNVRTRTADGRAYAAVLEALRIDRAVCERIYAHRFARHFYTATMLEDFTRRWSEED
jgi:hypothetical protein